MPGYDALAASYNSLDKTQLLGYSIACRRYLCGAGALSSFRATMSQGMSTPDTALQVRLKRCFGSTWMGPRRFVKLIGNLRGGRFVKPGNS